jgi:hypothetical protein
LPKLHDENFATYDDAILWVYDDSPFATLAGVHLADVRKHASYRRAPAIQL